ncbi:hypothetical protein [Rhodopila sp.]|uniref:hypothetical protein n=1 Tax=Rhodopila sp. TaxID=2480087 RepID=UPI003D0F7B00
MDEVVFPMAERRVVGGTEARVRDRGALAWASRKRSMNSILKASVSAAMLT